MAFCGFCGKVLKKPLHFGDGFTCNCEESIRAKQLSDEIAELKKAFQSKTKELEALNKHYVGLRAFTEHNEEVRTRLQKEGDLV